MDFGFTEYRGLKMNILLETNNIEKIWYSITIEYFKIHGPVFHDKEHG